MTISFNEIPADRRVPFVYIEFDGNNAVQGPQRQPYRNLHIGQRLSSGSVAQLVPTLITSKDQAADAFGQGSILQKMLEAQFDVSREIETWAVALDDDGGGVAASGVFGITGTATESGTLCLYVGGQRVKVAVTSGDTASTVATAVRAALNAVEDLVVVAGGSSGTVDVAAKNKGAVGNYIDLRDSYFDGEEVPAGIAVAITPMASGSGNPDVDDALATIGVEQFRIIVHPYTDQANIEALDEELEDRWGPITQNDGQAFTASNVALGSLSTLGNLHNSKFNSIIECTGAADLPWQIAAKAVARIAISAAIDPARPVQTLTLPGTKPPKLADRLTSEERNILLYDGISTLNIDAGGTYFLERVITTYKTNALGGDDPAFLDIETMNTLSYLRWDLRNYLLRKYPRHKLANDGTRFGEGQAIVTPKIMKAEIISRFREWEELGLVEGADQFKEQLIVERDESDPNRLNMMLPPDLVNQLRVTAVKIGFLL